MSQVALVMSLYCPKQKALDMVVTLSPASSLSQGQKHKGRVPAVLLTLPAPLTCSAETMCHDHCAKRRGHDVLFKTSLGLLSYPQQRPALNRSAKASQKCWQLPGMSEGCLASHTPSLIKAAPIHRAMLTSCLNKGSSPGLEDRAGGRPPTAPLAFRIKFTSA